MLNDAVGYKGVAPGYPLLLDSDWSPIGIAGSDSVEAAKRRAERIYPGSSTCWVEAHFTDEDVKRYLEET
jgi:hypothetical protein